MDVIASFVHGFSLSKDLIEDKELIQQVIGTSVDIILEFKNREIYDAFSLQLINADVFNILIRTILENEIERPDFKNIARIFELCACHTEGICILANHLDQIVYNCSRFMQPENDMVTIKYPASTVLLDLTANEQCIEKVAKLIRKYDILAVVIQELELAFSRRSPKTGQQKVYYSRFRDLMIGIVLNLTCNVENEEVVQYMLKQNVVRMLRKILVDPRHDWPTNGAALAILQYCHNALSDTDLFLMLEEN